jgi:CRISPR-associated protein Csb1
LGIFALTEQDQRGYALRSRCDLVCDGSAPLERVQADGQPTAVQIDRESARALYIAAFKQAQQAGFQFPDAPLRLTPQDKLVEIVRKSQELALRGEGGDEEEANSDGAGAGS